MHPVSFGMRPSDVRFGTGEPSEPQRSSPPSNFDVFLGNPARFLRRAGRKEVRGVDAIFEGCQTLVGKPLGRVLSSLVSPRQTPPSPFRPQAYAADRTGDVTAAYDPLLFDALSEHCRELDRYKLTTAEVKKLAPALDVSAEQLVTLAGDMGFIDDEQPPPQPTRREALEDFLTRTEGILAEADPQSAAREAPQVEDVEPDAGEDDFLARADALIADQERLSAAVATDEAPVETGDE